MPEPLIDEDACINCGEHVDAKQPHKELQVVSIQKGGLTGGSTETLESWPLCFNCESSQPATLSQYVKFALT